jgi:hypothetical protein
MVGLGVQEILVLLALGVVLVGVPLGVVVAVQVLNRRSARQRQDRGPE